MIRSGLFSKSVSFVARLALLLLCCSRFLGASCEALLQEKIAQVTILSAGQIQSGSFLPKGAADDGFLDLPPFCRIVASARPSADSDIRIEVWMPVDRWNGRILGTGNGGFAGAISYTALANGLKAGFATGNTDMGMAVPAGADASVFVGRPERWRDWGYRATHEMARVQAALVRSYYGQLAAHAYFSGCSTGGQQALMEAQRFPADYDGIIAGAPANNRTGVHLSILWNYVATHQDAAAYLPQDKLQLLHKAVLAACDSQDGLKDGLLGNPESCSFDPGKLLCKQGSSGRCLTSTQAEAARRIYAGPGDPATGASIYAGVPKGSELDWGRFGPEPDQKSAPPFAPIFQWVFGSDWDWRKFSFGDGWRRMEQLLAKDLNATEGNLNTFRARGGKLIAYHGLADWLVVPGEALRYRTALMRSTSGKLDDYYRLYLVPGMGHCGGGTGPNHLEALGPLVDWVERGIAPGQLLAERVPTPTAGKLERSICNYPTMALYKGSGDRNKVANYACVPVN